MLSAQPTCHANAPVQQFDILMTHGFVLSELAGIVDVLRIANRVSAAPAFRWTFYSTRGGVIDSSSGAFVDTNIVPTKPTADYAFVLGNTNSDHPDLSVGSAIAAYTFRKAKVLLLAEAASRYIKDRGDDESLHTTHWENSAILRERMGWQDPNFALAVEDGQVVTCAGMGATVDLTLALVGRHMPLAAVMTVADIMLHQKIRDFDTLQPFGGANSTTTGDRELDLCIAVMQANIEDPMPISDLVKVLDISSRSLERKFKSILNTTPNTFYREVRLNRANNLLLNTTMSIREIGFACGFPSGFSSLYKNSFGIAPAALRKQKRGAN